MTALKLWPPGADNRLIPKASMDDSGGDGPFRPVAQSVRQASPTNAGADTIIGEAPARTIEVVLSGARHAVDSLHICKRCQSQLVQASQWREVAEGCWELQLHCPNCGWRHRDTFSSGQLAALEEQVDGGFDLLLRDLKRLTAANMTEEIERFAASLDSGLILPEDF